MTILLSCQNSFDCPSQFIYYTLYWQDPNSSHKIALSEMWWKSSGKIPLGEKPQINYTYFKKRQYRQQWYQKELTFALVFYVLLLWAPISLCFFSVLPDVWQHPICHSLSVLRLCFSLFSRVLGIPMITLLQGTCAHHLVPQTTVLPLIRKQFFFPAKFLYFFN